MNEKQPNPNETPELKENESDMNAAFKNRPGMRIVFYLLIAGMVIVLALCIILGLGALLGNR